jgi:predicted ATP-dependent serine protease
VPAAGITLAVALLSLLTGRAARGDTAMTGELTLRGLVLPVSSDGADVADHSTLLDHQPVLTSYYYVKRDAGGQLSLLCNSMQAQP